LGIEILLPFPGTGELKRTNSNTFKNVSQLRLLHAKRFWSTLRRRLYGVETTPNELKSGKEKWSKGYKAKDRKGN
jgi:hypothetical protein